MTSGEKAREPSAWAMEMVSDLPGYFRDHYCVAEDDLDVQDAFIIDLGREVAKLLDAARAEWGTSARAALASERAEGAREMRERAVNALVPLLQVARRLPAPCVVGDAAEHTAKTAIEIIEAMPIPTPTPETPPATDADDTAHAAILRAGASQAAGDRDRFRDLCLAKPGDPAVLHSKLCQEVATTMKHFQSRRSGRFQRNTLENTFGLRAPVCSSCGGFNPHGANEPRPTKCQQCGVPLDDVTGQPTPETPGRATRCIGFAQAIANDGMGDIDTMCPEGAANLAIRALPLPGGEK